MISSIANLIIIWNIKIIKQASASQDNFVLTQQTNR